MNLRVPKGGFFAALEPDAAVRAELRSRLERSGVRALAGSGSVVLGAWVEFPGQGLWEGSDGAVAYDLDLSNEQELRAALGFEVGAALDAGELLWRLYREAGTEFLDRLRGPFGFALWDAKTQRFLAATDPYGIRPVVHGGTDGGVVVASRIRHALLHPRENGELDLNAIYQYLFFSAIPSPATIYQGIRKLEPGHQLEADSGKVRISQYYDIRYRPDREAGERFWKEAIPLEVRRAVARLVPLSDPDTTGCFLSGGTDSSSVAGYYTRVAGRPARTFSIGFDEPGYNEMDFAHIAARHFGTEQHDYFVTPEDVLALIETLPALYDEPFGNSSVIPTFYCARMAEADGVKVLLAGDGGDEIFGGNERYRKHLVFERYGRVPAVLRKAVLEPVLRALPGRGPIYKAQRYVRRANIPNPRRFYSYGLLAENDAAEVFTPEFLRHADTNCFFSLAQTHWDRAAPAHEIDRFLYLDMKFIITDNDLRKVTQMTEAAGVRVRYPLLDRDLVDFTGRIPPTLKVKPGKNRYIFKRAMEGFLPQEIIQKSKHGFGLPVAPWFRRDPRLRQLLEDALFASDAAVRQWVRPEFLEHMRTAFAADDTGYYGANFWVFLVLEMWMRKSRES